MEKSFVISNDQGIHARPATVLVQRANQFKSDMTITLDTVSTDLKSIMGVLSLGITRGSTIHISINGSDEVEAMESIAKVIQTINQNT